MNCWKGHNNNDAPRDHVRVRLQVPLATRLHFVVRPKYRDAIAAFLGVRSPIKGGSRTAIKSTCTNFRLFIQVAANDSFRIADHLLVIDAGESWYPPENTCRNNVAAYGIFYGTHTGQGGPVPPTGRKTSTDYVYIMQFDGDRIAHMTKVWNAGLALKDLGWA